MTCILDQLYLLPDDMDESAESESKCRSDPRYIRPHTRQKSNKQIRLR